MKTAAGKAAALPGRRPDRRPNSGVRHSEHGSRRKSCTSPALYQPVRLQVMIPLPPQLIYFPCVCGLRIEAAAWTLRVLVPSESGLSASLPCPRPARQLFWHSPVILEGRHCGVTDNRCHRRGHRDWGSECQLQLAAALNRATRRAPAAPAGCCLARRRPPQLARGRGCCHGGKPTVTLRVRGGGGSAEGRWGRIGSRGGARLPTPANGDRDRALPQWPPRLGLALGQPASGAAGSGMAACPNLRRSRGSTAR